MLSKAYSYLEKAKEEITVLQSFLSSLPGEGAGFSNEGCDTKIPSQGEEPSENLYSEEECERVIQSMEVARRNIRDHMDLGLKIANNVLDQGKANGPFLVPTLPKDEGEPLKDAMIPELCLYLSLCKGRHNALKACSSLQNPHESPIMKTSQESSFQSSKSGAGLRASSSSNNAVDCSIPTETNNEGIALRIPAVNIARMRPAPRKRRRKLPQQTSQILLEWLWKHRKTPYPSGADKKELLLKTGITMIQLRNWFSNARRRILKGREYNRRKVRKNPSFHVNEAASSLQGLKSAIRDDDDVDEDDDIMPADFGKESGDSEVETGSEDELGDITETNANRKRMREEEEVGPRKREPTYLPPSAFMGRMTF